MLIKLYLERIALLSFSCYNSIYGRRSDFNLARQVDGLSDVVNMGVTCCLIIPELRGGYNLIMERRLYPVNG